MYNRNLNTIKNRLINQLKRDVFVQKNLHDIQEIIQVDRVVLYYFYREWKGQVTAESLSDPELSIFGSTGADDCFNDEYASLYKAGRYRAIADIETEPINECHRNFLRSIQVKANLVVPVIVQQRLWGLLAAHDCQKPHFWSDADIECMKNNAALLQNNPVIINF